MPWYVLYTKSRNEKKLAKLLEERAITVYCPVKEEIRQWSDRKKKVSEPVFKSYIFVLIDDYETGNVSILETPGAVRFLWWNGKPGIVRDNEIQAIKDFLEAYKNAEITFEIKEGTPVSVKEGPLKDMKGVVTRVKGNRATLLLNTLGMELVATLPVQSLSTK